jgi:SAM-dependent methyltransferase
MSCAVCGTQSRAPLYRSGAGTSITSTAWPVAAPTIVSVCTTCAHVQTDPLEAVEGYYDTAYNVHLESTDADDLYAVREGVPVYRAQHQAGVVLAKVDLAPGAAVLDYGCGKGMSLRELLAARPDLDAAVFDVSDAYRDAWDTFVPLRNQAAYRPPDAWAGRFDAVLSFFALEHAVDPLGFLAEVRALLRPGGTLHLTVPNVRRNAGDLIVVDHVNHFMPSSLRWALAAAGFGDVRIDENSHDAAYVVNARRGDAEPAADPAPAEIEKYLAEVRRCAALWSTAADEIAAYERNCARGRPAAIYGSGFYGVFIASRLSDRSNLRSFLDRNVHQQAKRIFDRPVVAPEAISDDVEVVYAGLNPSRAREILAGVEPLRRRPRAYFFL